MEEQFNYIFVDSSGELQYLTTNFNVPKWLLPATFTTVTDVIAIWRVKLKY